MSGFKPFRSLSRGFGTVRNGHKKVASERGAFRPFRWASKEAHRRNVSEHLHPTVPTIGAWRRNGTERFHSGELKLRAPALLTRWSAPDLALEPRGHRSVDHQHFLTRDVASRVSRTRASACAADDASVVREVEILVAKDGRGERGVGQLDLRSNGAHEGSGWRKAQGLLRAPDSHRPHRPDAKESGSGGSRRPWMHPRDRALIRPSAGSACRNGEPR